MEENKKKLIKDGHHFKQFPAMKVAKIYSTNRSLEDRNIISPWTRKPVYQKLVEIALPKLNTQFNESIWFDDLLSTQVEIDWGIQLQNHMLDPSSDVLLVTGLIYGDIQYESKRDQKHYSRKIHFPWKSHSKLTFTYPPLKPKPDYKATHLFQSPVNQTIKHQTQYLYTNAETTCELIKAEVTSVEELEHLGEKTQIHLNVNADISLRLLQNQMGPLE